MYKNLLVLCGNPLKKKRISLSSQVRQDEGEKASV